MYHAAFHADIAITRLKRASTPQAIGLAALQHIGVHLLTSHVGEGAATDYQVDLLNACIAAYARQEGIDTRALESAARALKQAASTMMAMQSPDDSDSSFGGLG